MILDKVKIYLDFNDNLQDDLLNEIIDDYSQRVKNYIGENEIPKELEWVIKELTIIRYNRIGSEGLTSESQEGKSLSFKDGDPFDSYTDELDGYLNKDKEAHGKGKVKFLK